MTQINVFAKMVLLKLSKLILINLDNAKKKMQLLVTTIVKNVQEPRKLIV